MPECRENGNGGNICDTFIKQESIEDRQLRNICTDVPLPPEEEQSAIENNIDIQHVHIIHSDSTIVTMRTPDRDHKPDGERDCEPDGENDVEPRGEPDNEPTFMFPYMYATAKGTRIPIQDRQLVLVECINDPRSYVFKFVDFAQNECWFYLQPLTHTTVQIYTIEQWDGAISKVNRHYRGFKIAIAFRFKSHVLAFVSLDNLFKLSWAFNRSELPRQYPHIFFEFDRFLESVATWIQHRRGGRLPLKPKARCGNALLLVRDDPVWHGVGVYTVSEIWHMAGLSPFLTEEEVFDSPSRTARLCCAFYSFAAVTYNGLWKLTKQHMYGYFVAISVEDRLKYSNFLHVWGKDRTFISERHYKLLKQNPDGATSMMPDVFEPGLIHTALTLQNCNLGGLIFGTKGKINWHTISAAAGLQIHGNNGQDAISKHFSNIRTLSQIKSKSEPSTHLNLDMYECLFLAGDRPLAKHWIVPVLYRTNVTTNAKNMWSLFLHKTHPKFNVVPGEEYDKYLLQYLMQYSNIQTVGPFDFAGIGRTVEGGHGKSIMLVCEFDPLVNHYYVIRRTFERQTIKLKGKGIEHKGLNLGTKRKMTEDLHFNGIGLPNGEQEQEMGHQEEEEQNRPKKLRRSADRDIIASTMEGISGRNTRSRQRK
ncbi:hypothetical protein BDN70DRAFT_937309 [Pholiota conissans]|uniref:Uncharacterized protein n=1 Tax=Pholiota conissans TaxID=109636 RepID=A0A9P5YTF3_9AGAR|nr:hypothetical protein BDN70DRAFT_937309 [Pholiota conissans]